jgi:hypothetical protein
VKEQQNELVAGMAHRAVLGVPPEIAEHSDHNWCFKDLNEEEKLSSDRRIWRVGEAEDKRAAVANAGTGKGSGEYHEEAERALGVGDERAAAS